MKLPHVNSIQTNFIVLTLASPIITLIGTRCKPALKVRRLFIYAAWKVFLLPDEFIRIDRSFLIRGVSGVFRASKR